MSSTTEKATTSLAEYDKDHELYQGILTSQEFQKLREEFALDDVDHDGYVDKEQLEKVITDLYSHIFTETELKNLLQRYKDKKVDFYEFVGLFTAEKIEEKIQRLNEDPMLQNVDDPDVANARFVFSVFDADDSNRIDMKELQCMLRQMGKPCSNDDVAQIMHKFGKKHGDWMEFDEFLQMYKEYK